ncbi:MAG: hypothetical protein EOO29_53930 [Comamonadaceae bacterium]|nr:MAG: hypothetical protein EOO29_53930 [Comamonadaceae bacterium]
METLLAGTVAMGSAVVALFFFRFWHRTRDRFFLYFAASFLIEAGNRVALALVDHASEDEPMFYMVRLLAYGLILVAIWQKNRARR